MIDPQIEKDLLEFLPQYELLGAQKLLELLNHYTQYERGTVDIQLVGKTLAKHISPHRISSVVDVLKREWFIKEVSPDMYTIANRAYKENIQETMTQQQSPKTYNIAIPNVNSTSQHLIAQEGISIIRMLLDKNQKYGNSALNPLRIFSKESTTEQLRIRIDDKLSRIIACQDEDEDVSLDLIGYLILYRIALKKETTNMAIITKIPDPDEDVIKEVLHIVGNYTTFKKEPTPDYIVRNALARLVKVERIAPVLDAIINRGLLQKVKAKTSLPGSTGAKAYILGSPKEQMNDPIHDVEDLWNDSSIADRERWLRIAKIKGRTIKTQEWKALKDEEKKGLESIYPFINPNQ